MGFEVGRNGYRHYQLRLVSSNHDFFEWCKNYCPTAHVEEASTERDNYERKTGLFLTSNDTVEIRQVRFGNLRELQKEILQKVSDQNDRQIDVFVDLQGNSGKTWLSLHLWERGKACIVPRSECSASKISAYLCSSYKYEPYVVLDIPRTNKASDDLYESLEETKDGLVFDHRYSGKCRNIRGVKLIVFTNNEPSLRKLSHDRWRVHHITGLKTLSD